MMLVTWVRLGIGACLAAQRYDKLSAADVMQPQNIGQCQRLRVHGGEPVLEPATANLWSVVMVPDNHAVGLASIMNRCYRFGHGSDV